MCQMTVRRAFPAFCSFLLFVSAACGDTGVADVTCDKDGVVLEEGLEIRDVRCGSGPVADRGMVATIRYTASSNSGVTFDSNQESDEPYFFRLGAGQVLEGLDRGLAGMKVDGIRELVIPSELAYGDAGLYPDVGSNETVTYEVELLALREPSD